MRIFFLVLIFTLSIASKKFDIYDLNDVKDGETMKEIEINEPAKINFNQSDTAYVEDENVSLPKSFSENDYIRSFSLVKKQLYHGCISVQ